MDSDFSRMNGTSFERLARSLAFKSFGAGGVVYSSGPDGGRDFTIEGKIAGYEAKKWNGYLVLQAKYKEHSGGKDDVEWLLAQIETEFKKYSSEDIGLRPPEYYIVVTNIRLSGSDGIANRKTGRLRVGGHSKVSAALEKWNQIGVKGWDIWSADKIADLLSDAPAIRQSFAAWVTPGDVLSKVLQSLQGLRPEFRQIVSRSVKVSLYRDQFARLKDAGSVNDDQIRTSQVFIDLPLSRRGPADEEVPKIVSNLIERSKEKLDPDSISDDESAPGKKGAPDRNKIVLVGGPGQGKSTATLFLTQIFRATLLLKDPTTRRDPNVKKLVPEVLARASSEQISVDVPHRYPLNLALPRFADAVSAARRDGLPPPTLLSFIADEFSSVADEPVERSDVREWLGLHPWLLVLDGLDEVPQTGERPAVIKAINGFFTEVAEANADILTVVTTRPQGYNKDLDPELWEHWRLSDLSVDQALSYAKVFGEARYRDDKHRRSDVLGQLASAAKQPATARLMMSPLQVTILHFIVDTGGGVPAARWTLFNEYFEVLKRRERAKGGETQRVLEHHWGQLGPLHQRVGMILQSDSEHAGGAGGKLSHSRLRGIISSYLTSEGFTGEELGSRVDELMTLALNRLVLLSTQEEGQVQFDVRSLQEFMAAAALTSGDQSLMEARLSYIAGKTHWRHVFLIAASRCFADDAFHYRRSAIVGIARQLDVLEPDLLVRNGARLALDLLVDGIGTDHPISRRQLITHALETLHLGPDLVDEKFGGIWDEADIDLLNRYADAHLKGTDVLSQATAVLLFLVSDEHPTLALSHLKRWWPEDHSLALDILTRSHVKLTPELDDLAANTLVAAGPRAFRNIHRLRLRGVRLNGVSGTGRFMDLLAWNLGAVGSTNVPVINIDTGFSLGLVKVPKPQADPAEADKIPTGGSPDWNIFRLLSAFAKEPNKDILSVVLRTIAKEHFDVAKEFTSRMPWPMSACIIEANTAKDLLRLADYVAQGSRGDISDWSRAERRWQKDGISEADLDFMATGSWFGANVAQVGCPPFRLYSIHARENGAQVIEKLTLLADSIPNKALKEAAVDTALFCLHGIVDIRKLDHDVCERLFELCFTQTERDFTDIGIILPKLVGDADLSRRFGLAILDIPVHDIPEIGLDVWLDIFNTDPRNRSLLRALALHVIRIEDENELNAAMKALPEAAFQHLDNDHPRISEAVATTRLLAGLEANIVDDTRFVRSMADEDAIGGLFLEAVQNGNIPIQLRTRVLLNIIKETESEWGVVPTFAINQFRKALDGRGSEFSDRDLWVAQLKLPQDAFGHLLPVAPSLKISRVIDPLEVKG